MGGWYTRNAAGDIVTVASQEEIDAAVAADQPLLIVGDDEPASGEQWQGLPSGWTQMGATTDTP
jgi:hypothetical protein